MEESARLLPAGLDGRQGLLHLRQPHLVLSLGRQRCPLQQHALGRDHAQAVLEC